MDLLEYRDIFINEAQEYLQSLNQATLRLEKNQQDMEAIHVLFRAAHTLKGMAATMGFEAITELCHEMESVMDHLRSGAVKVQGALVDLLFNCIDALSELIGLVSSGAPVPGASPELLKRLKDAASGKLESLPSPQPTPAVPAASSMPLPAAAVSSALDEGLQVFQIKITLDRTCAFRGVRAYMCLRNLEKLGKILQSQPDTKTLEAGNFDYEFLIWLASSEGSETLRKACMKVMEVEQTEISLAPAPAPLQQVIGGTLSAPAAAGGVEKENASPAPSAKEAPPAADKAATQAPAAKPSIRVAVERLDTLMNLVGELVTHKIRLGQISKSKNVPELKDSLGQLERVVDELQDEVMSVRMVPMDQVFNRFPRMVRDLAHDLGKEVELEIVGKEIELDRTVLEEISDPLVHLLRNAIDHGIESPAQRSQAGKTSQGIIRLEARREKNNVLIVVEDDGAGLDPHKIKKSALNKGFITEIQASEMPDSELIQLIFLPGFSTASKVTNLSGRGVGLDVVKNKVESFGGSLRLESKPGLGTKFILRLPLTLAIIQALLVRLQKEIYAVPVANTIEVVEYAWQDLRRMQNQEIVLLRGQVLPVVRLAQILEVPGETEQTPFFTVLVAESGERRVGFMVDEILGQQEIAIKSLGRYLKGIRGFAGVTVLGDGRIALILDIPSLI